MSQPRLYNYNQQQAIEGSGGTGYQRWLRQWLKKIKASPKESERYNNEFIEFWNSLCDRPWRNTKDSPSTAD